MSNARFAVKFAPAAAKEYEKLDNSVINIVDVAIDKLEERADKIGTPLHNLQDTKLAGCKEIKLRDAGIRIVFKIVDQTVNILQVVYILTIESRSNDKEFKTAHDRYKSFKNNPSKAIEAGKSRPEKGRG